MRSRSGLSRSSERGTGVDALAVVMRKPGAAQRVESQRFGASRRFLRTANADSGDGFAIEKPLKRREGIIRSHAVRVGAGANHDADPLGGVDGRDAARQ